MRVRDRTHAHCAHRRQGADTILETGVPSVTFVPHANAPTRIIVPDPGVAHGYIRCRLERLFRRQRLVHGHEP